MTQLHIQVSLPRIVGLIYVQEDIIQDPSEQALAVWAGGCELCHCGQCLLLGSKLRARLLGSTARKGTMLLNIVQRTPNRISAQIPKT